MWLCVCACAGALALSGLAASSASAVTFGANLGSRLPNNQVACNDRGWFFFTQFPSCSFNSTNLSTGENAFPPTGRGIITKVRVRVGPVTGPMQIVVEEALRYNNPVEPGKPTYACCKAINASPIFTPTANQITEIPVSLPIRQDLSPDPTGVFVDQHLSLSVLAPNVPIPANIDPNGFFGGWFPAWTVGEQRTGVYGGQGAVVLFNADWQACPGARAAAESARKKKKKKRAASACGPTKRKKKKKKRRS